MLISAASQRSDPSRMCRLIASSASAILSSSDAEDQAAQSVYVATILRLLQMFQYHALRPHYYSGGVLSRQPLFQPVFRPKRSVNVGQDLDKAFSSALTDVFGDANREESIGRLTQYFLSRTPGASESDANAPKATLDEAKRFLSKLADEITA